MAIHATLKVHWLFLNNDQNGYFFWTMTATNGHWARGLGSHDKSPQVALQMSQPAQLVILRARVVHDPRFYQQEFEPTSHLIHLTSLTGSQRSNK